MKKISASIFPYQDLNITNENEIIFSNMWKIVPNFSKNESKQFFFFNIELENEVAQVGINIQDVNDIYKLGHFLINQDYNKKFDIEKDFIATLDNIRFIELLNFLKKDNIKYNLLLSPIFAFRQDKENVNIENTDIFLQYNALLKLLNDNFNIIKEGNGRLFINDRLLGGNKENTNTDIYSNIKDNIEKLEINIKFDINNKNKVEAVNILTTTFKQDPNILWEIWNNNYDINENIKEIDIENIDNKDLFFSSKINSNEIKLPKFNFEDKEFDKFIEKYDKEYKEFGKIYEDKNKQEETIVKNVLYFKFIMLNTLEYYFNTLGVKIDKKDFLWLVFDTSFLELAIDLKQPHYIENLELFNSYLLEQYTNKIKQYNEVVDKYGKKYVKINGKKFSFKEYLDKILYEFTVLYYTGYINYLLIVMDYIIWGKKNNILIGPGRGSAAGSLLVFLLQITNIDPIPYDLMFERFLNPARVSPPDIDVDFEDEYRSAVLAYTQQKYGIDKVFKIGTFATLGLKSAFAQSGIYYGFDPQKRLKIQNIIDDFEEDILSDEIDKDIVEKIIEASNIFTNEEEKDILSKIITSINYINKKVINVGLHACGVIISPYTFNFTYNIYEEKDRKYLNKMYNMFPEKFMNQIIKDGTHETIKATLIEGPDLEGIVGLLKFDFLGLSTLSLIKRTVELINEKENKNIDTLKFIDEITFNKINDQKTFEIFQKGFTTGVFQFESGGMKKFLKQLKPDNIEDIIAMNALYRPGPIGFIPLFIKRKWTKDIDKLNILNLYFEAKDIFLPEIKKSIYKYLFNLTIINGIIGIEQISVKEQLYRTIINLIFNDWILEQEAGVIIYKSTFFSYLKDKLLGYPTIINDYGYEFKKKDLIDFIDNYDLGEILSKIDKKYYTFISKLQKTNLSDDEINGKDINTILSKYFNEKEINVLTGSYKQTFLGLLTNNYQINFLDKSLEKQLIKKYGQEKIDDQIKQLNKLYHITEQTYGIFVYQEQLMNLSKILAGFSSNDADGLRKIIGKKKLEKIPALRKDFVKGCVEKNDVLTEIAEYLFDAIIKPAGEYAFNKSHAAAYSSVAFITAYLKRYYPSAFFTALMDINLSKGSSEKEVDNTKVFNGIRDITLANEIGLYPDQIFTIKNYSLTDIKPSANYTKKIAKKDGKDIIEVDVYLNTKGYIGLSTKFLEKIEQYKKDGNSITIIYDLIKDKIANKKETSAIFNSLYFDINNLDYILTESQIKEIKEKTNLLYENLKETGIKKYFIEYLICHYLFSDKESYDIFFVKITEFIKKFEKELLKKGNGYNNGLTLFGMDDFGIKEGGIEEEIEKELLKKEKTNFREIIQIQIDKINSLLKRNEHNYKFVLLQLLTNNIIKTFEFNKIDYLITKKTVYINKLYPELSNTNNFYLLLNVIKTNRGQDFMIKYLSADLSNVKKKTFTKTKYNIEYFNSMVINKGKLSYKIGNGYILI